MSESSGADSGQFNERVRETFALIEKCLDAAEIDVEAVGDGILEIEFSDDSKIIINRHGVAHEIWVAARSGGFHFRWDGAGWIDTRSGDALYATLSRLLAEHAGQSVEFK